MRAARPKQATKVDRHVGRRVRLMRELQGMSQSALGEKLGVTFQQVQKYERGESRISATRLFQIAASFNVSIAYFFDSL
jgi:transcriptional regulator with XRE-family HTH domain